MTETDPKHGSKTRLTVLLVSVGFIIGSPIFLLILFGMGQVRGVEFSPDDFSRRSFAYNQMPLVDWVVFKKTFEDKTTDLEQQLVADKLVIPVINKKKNWHLVSESSSSVISHECDARFLTGFMDSLDNDGANYWDTWNTEHPNCAKVFWPYVAELARDQMYLNIGKVMNVAMDLKGDDPVEFDLRMTKTLGEVYLELGIVDLGLGRLERARHRLDRSIHFAPTREAFQQRSDCLEQLGLVTESKQDTQSAAALSKSNAVISEDAK